MSGSALTNTTTARTTPAIFPGEASRVAQMVVTVLIFAVGVPLNGLVVWVLGVRRGRASGRRGSTGSEARGASSFRIYVVNLALADLVLLLRTPLMLGYLGCRFSWPFGLAACRLVMFLRCLGLYAGAFLLCAVAAERCLCLLRPVWARLQRPRWAVPVVCVVLWLLAGALATPYLRNAELKEWYNHTQCIESGPWAGVGLFVVETVAGFLLPLIIFLSSNLAVLLSARRAERGMDKPTADPSPTSSSAPYTSQRLARLYRVLFLTMLLFLTCWVPYFACRFVKTLSERRPGWKAVYLAAETGSYVSLFLVYVKSALNPVLYVFAARGLSRTVRASLLSTVERIFNDETSESLRRKSLRRGDSQL